MAEQPNPVLNAVGALLAVLGGVWLVLAGGCTLLFAGASVWELATRGDDSGMLAISLISGAVCIAPGALMFFVGRAILKAQKAKDSTPAESFR